MNRLLAVFLLAALAGLGEGPAFAAAETKLDRAPIDLRDTSSLQSGARTFANYCLNCHSASLMRYSQLMDLGFTEPQIKDDLLFTGEKKVGQMMLIGMSRADAKSWFGSAPPDL